MKPEPEGEQSREKLAALALSKLRISWYHFIDKALLCLDWSGLIGKPNRLSGQKWNMFLKD